MISARQIKAARALIGFSQLELAARAGVGIATLKRLELSSEIRGHAGTLAKLETALVEEGVVFIASDGALGEGVRLRTCS